MKLTKLALSGALGGLLLAGSAYAQSGYPATTPLQRTAFEYGDYYSNDPVQSPSDQAPAANAPTAPAAAANGACNTCCQPSCDTCYDDCGCGCGWPCAGPLSCLGDPCLLADNCCFKSRGVTAAGWVAQSFTWNPYNPADKFNGPVTWTDRANEYQLNEIYFYLEKKAQTDGCCLDWGYRADALYGTNYRWNTAAGLESNFGINETFYGLALPQFYVEAGINDWQIKAGHFLSPVGFYAVGTANNFFPVLPYTFQYGEPFTHTGVLATKKLSDDLSLGGGITYGWDNFDSEGNDHAGALATANYAINDKESLAYVGVFGQEPNLSGASGGFTFRYLQTLVYANKFSDDVAYYFQTDYGTQEDAVNAGDRAQWYGINQYLYWNMTCRMQWGLGVEWFRDDGGFRVGQALPSLGSPNARGFARGPGFDGSFYQVTFGPKYYFTPNLYTRVAVRADWYHGEDVGGQDPFDDGTKTYQQIGVFDLVWTF